jgi:hypothetical protein
MSKKMIPCIYIGTSGCNYEHWKDIFYPATFAESAWLQFYAQRVTTVEVRPETCGEIEGNTGLRLIYALPMIYPFPPILHYQSPGAPRA